MSFCIPKQLARELRQAAKRGEIKVAELYEMTSEQRRKFFEYYTDTETSKGINAGFERAMVSEHKNALKTWAKNTFSVKEKRSTKYKTLLEKIEQLSNDNLLNPTNRDQFLQDLIAEKLGATVTLEEAEEIDNLSKDLQKKYDKKDEFGNPSIDYWKQRSKLDDYLKSIVPSSKVSVATSIIGRSAMLLSWKSPVLNIIGNTIQGIEQAFERRIENARYSGKVDKKLVKNYIKTVNEIYDESDYDITRMQSLSDGTKILGEDIVHSEGKGVVRRIGKIAENIVFKQLLGKPDVYFASLAFADSANLTATRLAKDEGLRGKQLKDRANDLFKKAVSLENQNDIKAEIIRSQAIADAQFATFTNDSKWSEANLKIRKALNDVTGELKVGDQIMPFVKTPANVVSMTLDTAGLSGLRGVKDLPRAIRDLKQGDADLLRKTARNFARTGFGMMIAFIIANLFDKEDFIGAYPTSQKERELLKSKNARANSLKIGDKWVSVEYFGFLGSSLIGFLYAKKYKENLNEAMFNYASGAFSQIMELPAIDPVQDVIEYLQDISPGGKITADKIPENLMNGATDYVRARTIPAIFYDLAKAFDASEREVDYNNPMEKVKSTIPGLRQTLPEKLDVFGEVIKGEPAYSVMLFGARVKSKRDNEIIKELDRLHQTGNLPSLTRPEKTSSRVKSFKNQVSEEKFEKTMTDFRNLYKDKTIELIESKKYKKLTDEEKKKKIDYIKNKALDISLKKNGYKKEKK